MPRTADAEARDRVVAAASRLFYAKGIRAVGMSEVIAEAGCGKNLVYRYFPSKDDLVAAYLERFLDTRERLARQAADEAGDDPREQILALTRDILDRSRHRAYRGCAARNYLVESHGERDAAAEVARAYLKRSRRDLRSRVGAVGVADPDVVTERIWLIHEGLYGCGVHGTGKAAGAQAVAMVEELLPT